MPTTPIALTDEQMRHRGGAAPEATVPECFLNKTRAHMSDPDQKELFSDWGAFDLTRLLLKDLHDDLPSRVERLRYVFDLSAAMGTGSAMIFGGLTAFHAYEEARGSFVHGNYIATNMLCQSLLENLLAALLYAAGDELPPKVHFSETLRRCRAKGVLSLEDSASVERLANLRNPLSHFRDVNDSSNLTRRFDQEVSDLLKADAYFAIGIAIKVLSKPPFKIGSW
jgi:hypothetical protein